MQITHPYVAVVNGSPSSKKNAIVTATLTFISQFAFLSLKASEREAEKELANATASLPNV